MQHSWLINLSKSFYPLWAIVVRMVTSDTMIFRWRVGAGFDENSFLKQKNSRHLWSAFPRVIQLFWVVGIPHLLRLCFFQYFERRDKLKTGQTLQGVAVPWLPHFHVRLLVQWILFREQRLRLLDWFFMKNFRLVVRGLYGLWLKTFFIRTIVRLNLLKMLMLVPFLTYRSNCPKWGQCQALLSSSFGVQFCNGGRV